MMQQTRVADGKQACACKGGIMFVKGVSYVCCMGIMKS